MARWFLALQLLMLLSAATAYLRMEAGYDQQHATNDPQPDMAGLLALKASICGSNCSELASWDATGDVCAFEGVFCRFIGGSWRAVGVHVQLNTEQVLFNDSQLEVAGALQVLPYLRELELLCVVPRRNASLAGFTPLSVEALLSGAPYSLTAHQQQLPAFPGSLEAEGFDAVDAAVTLSHASSSSLQQWPSGPAARIQEPTPAGARVLDNSSTRSRATSSINSRMDSRMSIGNNSTVDATLGSAAAAAAAPGNLPPRWFLAYPHLTYFRVAGCGASGTLPPELTAAQRLSSLVLTRNKLHGSLPEQLTQLQNLVLVDLSGNAFTGTLPTSWASLPRLSYLYLNANNLTLDALPCEWTGMRGLKLADLSGNRWKSGGVAAAASCRRALPGGAGPAAAVRRRGSSSGRTAVSSSSLRRSGVGAGLYAPRCWLQSCCTIEGAFICLARPPQRPYGGCTSYLYGNSNSHSDTANQCDHGGMHLVAVAVLWLAFITAMLLIWLHHCRVKLRWMQPLVQQRGQRQWLVTGPAGPSSSAAGTRLAGGQQEHTLPLLYHAQARREDGAGYTRPGYHGGLAESMDRAGSEYSGTYLPSALVTPPAMSSGGARYMIVRRGSGAGSGYDSDASGSSSGQLSERGAGRLGRGGLSGRGSPVPLAAVASCSDDASSSSCNPSVVVPLVFLFVDVVTDVRLLLLWGLGPPAEVKLWPSYVLLGFLCVPHVLVGAVVNFRLLAAACLPPALEAASGSAVPETLPPGAFLLKQLYSWLFALPCLLAYPLLLVLLVPGVALLTVLCPLTLLVHALGLATNESVVRYLQLLQGSIALSESPGCAVLLTVLFLMGNVPLEYALLDSALYYVNLVASMADMSAAWWLKLEGSRREQLSQLAVPPAALL